MSVAEQAMPARVTMTPTETGVEVRLSGAWLVGPGLPHASTVLADLASVRRITFDASEVSDWDTGLLTFLVKIIDHSREHEIEVDHSELPHGVQRLLRLAYEVPEHTSTRRADAPRSLLAKLGQTGIDGMSQLPQMLAFLGEATQSLGRFVTGRARYQRSELFLTIQACGVQALPIVSLISFLIGLILAFVGAAQLRVFAAEIYTANLVTVGMAREMAPIMTGIVMSGRTGAAFAAQLGTMTVNDEIDALRTMGIRPMDFLVLPRMLALMLMMPLLCVFSNVLGMIGGACVAVGMFGVNATQYWAQTLDSASLGDFAVGLFKASVFGVLVALAGCMRGMSSGRSAAAVGDAATSAVVLAIVLIIVSDALFAILFQVLGI